MRNFFDILERVALPIAVFAIGPMIAAARLALRRWGTGPAREWPTISAGIDIASVVEEIREGRYDSVQTTGYTAVLTYFYRNPDLQMGEYKRFFLLETSARQWAEKYKGRQVVVHVNPRDPSDSVLLKSDLDGLGPAEEPSLEESLGMEKLPRLKKGYLLLSGVSEIISLIGLVITSVALWLGVGSSARTFVIILLVFNVASTWIVTYRADDSRSYQALLRSYTLFCPAWMRWGVTLTGALLFAAWLAFDLRDIFPQGAQNWLAVCAHYWPYLLAFWGFFSTGATHAAILRSQELARHVAEEAVKNPS